MFWRDFEYDGQRLSDFGSMVCAFEGSPDFETTDIGSAQTINTSKNTAVNTFDYINTTQDSPYTLTFQIGKNPCRGETDVYSEGEVSQIMRWLNRNKHCKFTKIFEDGECSDIYYIGTFTIQKIMLINDVVGFELTLNTDSGFAHYAFNERTVSISEEGGSIEIEDISDNDGSLPLYMELVCSKAGTMKISWDKDSDNEVIIANCVNGEKLTLNSFIKNIESSETVTRIWDRFNYIFPKISNDSTETSRKNTYTFSLPCTVTYYYKPICKALI